MLVELCRDEARCGANGDGDGDGNCNGNCNGNGAAMATAAAAAADVTWIRHSYQCANRSVKVEWQARLRSLAPITAAGTDGRPS